jgi:Domain of unknown function (DUF3127)
MDLQGQIKAIMPVKETATFKSIEVIITTDFDGTYPQHISCQLTQGRCDLIKGLNIGDLVTAEFNLKGREWNGDQGVKYFNSIEIWKLNKN